jgi:hypothetical protein
MKCVKLSERDGGGVEVPQAGAHTLLVETFVPCAITHWTLRRSLPRTAVV